MRLERRHVLAAAVVAAGLAALAGPVILLTTGDRSQAAFGGEVGVSGRLSSASVDVEPGQRTVPITVAALPPGDRAAGTIEVENVGSLPVHYALLVDPPTAELGRWLAWDLWFPGPNRGCEGPVPDDAPLRAEPLEGGGTSAVFGDPAPGFDEGDRILAPGARELLCLAVALPLEAPDGLQGAAITPTFVVAAEHHLEARP